MPSFGKFLFNIFSIFLAALFIVPTIAIVASWNSIPGDTLYSTKRTLENFALAFTAKDYDTNSSLQTQLVARRTSEATDSILKKASSQGLDELEAQVLALKNQISSAPKSPARTIASGQAVRQLKKTQRELRQTKNTLAYAPTTTSTTITIIKYIPFIQPSPTPEPNNTFEIIEDLENLQEDIEEIIEDLENLQSQTLNSPSEPSFINEPIDYPNPTPTTTTTLSSSPTPDPTLTSETYPESQSSDLPSHLTDTPDDSPSSPDN